MAGQRLSRSDKIFFYSLLPFAGIVLAIFILLLGVLLENSLPIFEREGLGFIATSIWSPSESSPEKEYYGILSAIFGTFYTSLIALILAVPASISLAIFINEYTPFRLRRHIINMVEIMAGLPTVLYGLWGLFILAPFLKKHVMNPLSDHLGFLIFFSCRPTTPLTVFTAGVVLAIMIIPFITSIVREAYELIPLSYREAALSIGATRYEYARLMLSLIKPAILAAVLLGFGRAAGETIAVSMVVGNSFSLSPCLFVPGYTISALIANQFSNAGFYHYMTSALYGAGFVLLLIGLMLNTIGLYILMRWRRRLETA